MATRMRVLGETKLGPKEIDNFLNAVLPAAAAVARRTDGAVTWERKCGPVF